MIDLHLHTFFSDGKIADVEKIIQHNDIISITDHNTIEAYKYFADYLPTKKIIVGCEITVEGAPDYLLYFPDTFYIKELENKLEEIRLAEENVIKNCYYSLGYHKWEEDIKVAFPVNQKLKNARTRDLAAIIHLYRTGLVYDNGKFDFCDLNVARKQRRLFANDIGNPVPENIAFEIAKEYSGKIVLAHPIHTALKRCLSKDSTLSIINRNLKSILKSFVDKGGKYIEWEYLSEGYLKKYNLNVEDINQLQSTIKEVVEENNMKYTIGTDSHSLDRYDEAIKWLRQNEKIVKDKLAVWISSRLDEQDEMFTDFFA